MISKGLQSVCVRNIFFGYYYEGSDLFLMGEKCEREGGGRKNGDYLALRQQIILCVISILHVTFIVIIFLEFC